MARWVALPLFLVFRPLTNGEEIGWRGYALPRLADRHSALVASLVVGSVWALWHVPKFLSAGGAQDHPFSVFVFSSVAKAIVNTWVFVGTPASLLTVTLLHAAWNTAEVFHAAVLGLNRRQPQSDETHGLTRAPRRGGVRLRVGDRHDACPVTGCSAQSP